ncbi:hypothetical protein [Chitinophaga flava]|uniref:Uncharacterized protein n=1 Tax=Chitinophaga flava TaxID=2259036 RepID=A0A365XZS1_9BACT|nr:hypothetical protein [Chitinophaga flava]RBL91164.1 hypothetical protein DF182_00640 [Chitinophaga flava]
MTNGPKTPMDNRINRQPFPGATHTLLCNCQSCLTRQPGRSKYKTWRERRSERFAKPQTTGKCTTSATPPDHFLGPLLANAIHIGSSIANNVQHNTSPGALSAVPGKPTTSPLISIGARQRAALLRYWQEKLKRSRSPIVTQRYHDYIKTIEQQKRPSWHQSEKDLQLFFRQFAMPGQRTFLNNQPVKWTQQANGRFKPPAGSVIPDINPADTMIEVKNYNINNQANLIRTLQKQIARRRLHGPQDAAGNPLPQRIILDARGQHGTPQQLRQLAKTIAIKTNLPADAVQIVTWEI